MERALYRYQIAVNYENEGCYGDVNFHASHLLTPDVYVNNPLKESPLPFDICMLQVQQQELPVKFNDTYFLMWENVTFVELDEGYWNTTDFTCYKGWQYQILANDCLDQAVQVQVRIDSGGKSEQLVDRGCVERAYLALKTTIQLLVFIVMIFTCTCCCCLFCDCCFPCAKFCARIKVEDPQVITVQVSELQENSQQTPCSSNEQPVAQKRQEDTKNRASIHSKDGQTRWITFSVCISSAMFLWISIYPPVYHHDPNREDFDDENCTGWAKDGYADGYLKKVCSFTIIFVSSYFMGIVTFIIVLSNYTTREDPWFRFRVIISGITLLMLNFIFVLDIVTFFYRYQYVEMVIRYYYAFAIICIHLLAADFMFVYVIVLGYGQNNNKRILDRAALVKQATIKEKQEMENQNLQNSKAFLLKQWLYSFWDALKEENGFSYSIFMLISVTAAVYLIVYIFITLMYKRDDYLDCLKDFNGCISRELETYVVFIQRNVGIDTALTLLGDVDVTQFSASDVNDTISDIQVRLDSLSSSPDSQLVNITTAISSMASLCGSEGTISLLAAAIPAMQQICQSFNSSQLQPLLLTLQGDLVSTLAQQSDQIQKILADTGSLLGRTQTLIVGTTESSSEWSQNIDTPFEVASIIGLVIGLLMGLSVLYITLVSYKKMSIRLTLEKVVMALSKDGEQGDTLKHTLENFTVISSIYFFGIVMSTSVIQLYIFTFVLTFILTVLFSPWFWTQFLKEYYPYIAVYVGILVINAVIVTRLGQRLISSKDQSIKRPALWLAYYIICSFAYLLLGTLFAVYRIVYLLLTSLIAVNRLDISLFTLLPQLDNGHKAFMGMVLMAQGLADIGRGKDRKKKKAEARWKKLRVAVQDEESQFLKKVRESPLMQSSLFSLINDNDSDLYQDDEHHQGPFLSSDTSIIEDSEEQVATIKRFLGKSKTMIDRMDANTIPQAQVRSRSVHGPLQSHVASENIPDN
eukprot:TRINITY_DN467_c0_g2_i1.p1 TRINITY_DN467_c0_g2~~TRINITY_DN467_c0_g2_i1.p1  ORF type:complete len:1072 (+),score=86.37 TRINITY_DN467_c0_g2_i1:288-3218(+)